MFDVEGFDSWALDYEREAAEMEAEGGYPFGGRTQVLDLVAELAHAGTGAKVLDLGCGPGILLERFAQAGCEVYGIDSSNQMLALAEKRVPAAHLALADLRDELPAEWGSGFAAIISTYAIHHIPDADKIALIRRLLGLLAPGGAFLIGDVAFADEADRLAARAEAGESWDDDEYYTVVDVLAAELPGVSFHKVTPWSGVVEVRAS
jgi:putative AdoMet-dependent methyltransferase